MRRVLEFPKTPRRRDTGVTGAGHQRHTGPSHRESSMESSTLTTPLGDSIPGKEEDSCENIRAVEVPTSASRSYAARRTGRFLKGPIPWSQIATAARLGGAALPLLLLVHHQIAVGAGPAVTLPLRLLAELGIDRRAKSRGLHALERAGLVRVARERGRPARVSLIRDSVA
jgi:DNA-binding transcriptional ArsR family regulator